MKLAIRPLTRFAAAAVAALGAATALAYDGIVKKESFTIPAYATVCGQTIRNVRVGYETYGKLNAARDNVILICHFFSGTSHAAGKYSPDDSAPGYWDAIIGAGKPIDTDRFFVVSSDTLVNLNAKVPNRSHIPAATINPFATPAKPSRWSHASSNQPAICRSLVRVVRASTQREETVIQSARLHADL